MKKILKLTALSAVLLSLVGGISSCEKINDLLPKDSKNKNKKEMGTGAIIGKWELVELRDGLHNEPQKHKPAGYVEYFPDGRFGWYDYATQEFNLFEGKYWVDNTYGYPDPAHQIDEGWVLHYETTWIKFVDEQGNEGEQILGPDFFDKPVGFNFQLKFIDQNTHSLYCLDLMSYAPMPNYIYERKK